MMVNAPAGGSYAKNICHTIIYYSELFISPSVVFFLIVCSVWACVCVQLMSDRHISETMEMLNNLKKKVVRNDGLVFAFHLKNDLIRNCIRLIWCYLNQKCFVFVYCPVMKFFCTLHDGNGFDRHTVKRVSHYTLIFTQFLWSE